MQKQLSLAIYDAAHQEAKKLYPSLRNKIDYLNRQKHIKRRMTEYENDLLNILIKITFLN